MDSGDLKFPLDCQYRIIAENRQNMHFVIETVLLELGILMPLVDQRMSSDGRYFSFSVDVRVDSLEMMNAIDAALRAIDGVRMVL